MFNIRHTISDMMYSTALSQQTADTYGDAATQECKHACMVRSRKGGIHMNAFLPWTTCLPRSGHHKAVSSSMWQQTCRFGGRLRVTSKSSGLSLCLQAWRRNNAGCLHATMSLHGSPNHKFSADIADEAYCYTCEAGTRS